MNILFLDQFSDLGGAQHCLLDLIPAVRSAGWQAHVALPGDGRLFSRLDDMGVPTYPIQCGPYSSSRKSSADTLRFACQLPFLIAAIRKLARRLKADLLYVNGPRVLPAAAWCASGRLPLVFHCHNRLEQPSAQRLAGLSIRLARAQVVACCRFAVEPLARYAHGDKIHLVHNGVPPLSDPFPNSSRESFTRIGLVGRIGPEKGQMEFLEAARLLTGILPEAQFIVCGDALFSDPEALHYRRSLDRLAAGLPVKFIGWREDVYQVMAELDVLVVPSAKEPGAPRVVLEAFACGLPVIAFPSGGIPEIVTDGETGFLVNPSTPEALAKRISQLVLEEPQRLRAAAQAAHAAWRERHTRDRYQRQLLRIVAQSLDRRPAHRLPGPRRFA